MSDEKFIEFKRIWGVDGMPADKIKLATAAFADGRADGIAWAERATAELCAEIANEYHQRDPVHFIACAISDTIKEKFGLEI
jgi:hypothetical protein